MLQVLEGNKVFYLDMDICIMEPGGVSSHPRHSLKVMYEFFRLERDIGYKIPTLKRIEFFCRSYLKYSIYKIKYFLKNN
jgi:hypothetical protein